MTSCGQAPRPEVVVVPYKPQPKLLIMLDPGHGGKDLGTHDVCYQEKTLTLETALLVESWLRQAGYPTLMTRRTDKEIHKLDRAALANQKQPALFVSIHYNSAPSKEAEGIEVFYYDDEQNPTRTAASQLLAKTLYERVLNETQAKSRGVKKGDYAVIRETTMPAVLIEGGFLTNKSELTRLQDPAYRARLARAIAQGIDLYARSLFPEKSVSKTAKHNLK